MGSFKVEVLRLIKDLDDEPDALLELAKDDPSIAVDVLNALNEIIEDSQAEINELENVDTLYAVNQERRLEGIIDSASLAMYNIVKNDEIVTSAPEVIEKTMSLTKDLLVNKIGDGFSYTQFHGYHGFAHVDNPYAFHYEKTSPIHAYIEAAKRSTETAALAITELKSMAEIGALAPGMAIHCISELSIDDIRVVPSAHEALKSLVEGGVLKDDYVHSHFSNIKDQYVVVYSPDDEPRKHISERIVYDNPAEKMADFVLKTRFSSSSDPVEMYRNIQDWAEKGLISEDSAYAGRKLLEKNVYQLAKNNYENNVDLNENVSLGTTSPMGDRRSYAFTSDSSLFHMVATSKQHYLDAQDALDNLMRYAEEGRIDNASAAFFIAKIGSSSSEYGSKAMPLLVDLIKKGMDDGEWRYFGPGTSDGRLHDPSKINRKVDHTWQSYGDVLIGEGRSTDALIQLTNENSLIAAEDTAELMRDLHAQGYISEDDMDYGLKKIKAMPQIFQNIEFVSSHQQLINIAESEASINVFDNSSSHLSKDVYDSFARNDLLFKGDTTDADILAKGNVFIAGNLSDSNIVVHSSNVDFPLMEVVISGAVSGNTSITMKSGGDNTLIIKGDVGPDCHIDLSGSGADLYVYGTIHPDASVEAARIVSEIDTGILKVQLENNKAESYEYTQPVRFEDPEERVFQGLGNTVQ